jgi:hypothetical protein
MLTLTTPIQIPNATKIKCEAPHFDDEAVYFECRLRVQCAGNVEYKSPFAGGFKLIVRNGLCEGVEHNGAASTVDGIVQRKELVLPTGYTDLVAAYHASGNNNAVKLRNVETWAASVLLLPPGTVGAGS